MIVMSSVLLFTRGSFDKRSYLWMKQPIRAFDRGFVLADLSMAAGVCFKNCFYINIVARLW